jgi:WD40 repeat protein
LWDAERGQPIRAIDAGFVSSVGFSPDGRVIAAGGFHNSVTLWDAASGKMIRNITWSSRNRHLVAYNGVFFFSAEGKTISTASGADSIIRVWDIASGRLVRRFRASFFGSEFIRNGRIAISAGADGRITLRDATSGKLIRRFVGNANGVSSFAVSPDEKLIGVAGRDGAIRIWSLKGAAGKSSIGAP